MRVHRTQSRGHMHDTRYTTLQTGRGDTNAAPSSPESISSNTCVTHGRILGSLRVRRGGPTEQEHRPRQRATTILPLRDGPSD